MLFGTRLRLTALALLASAPAALAQPVVDLRIVPAISGGVLTAQVQMRTSTGTDALGTTTLRMAFNEAALNVPSGRAEACNCRLARTTDYTYQNFSNVPPAAYDSATVTYPAVGRLSVNINLLTSTGTVVSGPTAWTDVVALRFTIVDPTATAGLRFLAQTEGGGQEIYDDDQATEWVLGSVTGNNDLLPVELTSFAAASNAGRVSLTWATASETNNAGFHVEHRPDGDAAGPWRDAGFVAGARTTAERQSYAFDVANLEPGPHRFRLRQVDLDGTATYSGEVEAAVAMTEPARLSAGPNPARGAVRVGVAVREAQAVRVEVFDALGRRVATLLDEPLGGSQPRTVPVDVGAWAAGTYVVRLTGEGGLTAQRVLTVVR